MLEETWGWRGDKKLSEQSTSIIQMQITLQVFHNKLPLTV